LFFDCDDEEIAAMGDGSGWPRKCFVSMVRASAV
jgi:hypothetical protein